MLPRGKSLITSGPSFFLKSHLQRFFSTGRAAGNPHLGLYPLAEAAVSLSSIWAMSLSSFYGQATWHPAAVPQSTLWEWGTLLYARSLGERPAWEGRRVPGG